MRVLQSWELSAPESLYNRLFHLWHCCHFWLRTSQEFLLSCHRQHDLASAGYGCDRSRLQHVDRQVIADVLTWDCASPVSPEEVETIASEHDIVWVLRRSPFMGSTSLNGLRVWSVDPLECLEASTYPAPLARSSQLGLLLWGGG
jgi:hypothetical protein